MSDFKLAVENNKATELPTAPGLRNGAAESAYACFLGIDNLFLPRTGCEIRRRRVHSCVVHAGDPISYLFSTVELDEVCSLVESKLARSSEV